MLVVALVLVLLLAVSVSLDVRHRLQTGALVRGLRADVNHLAREVGRVDEDQKSASNRIDHVYNRLALTHQQMATSHGLAAMALDRILYYTRNNKALGTLGQAYDRAVKKVQAKMEAAAKAEADAKAEGVTAAEPEIAAAENQSELVDAPDAPDVAAEDSAQVVGSIGTPCG